jgi:hypothetical protein
MIEQFFSNKNEIATVPKTKKFSELNKALVGLFNLIGKSATYIPINIMWPVTSCGRKTPHRVQHGT